MASPVTNESFIARSRAIHADRFDYGRARVIGFTAEVELVCREHGSFRTTPKAHLYSSSGGCAQCRQILLAKALSHSTESFVQRAKVVHGDHYDYSQVHYSGCLSRLTVICPLHGAFTIRARRHLEGRGCRQCASQRLREERRLSFWDFVERVARVHGPNRYEYQLADFANLHSAIPIKCPRHGVFRQRVGAHLKGSGCPRCAQSRGEQRVRESLLKWGVTFQEQARFAQCRDRRQLPFDFFVPDHRLLIEYDGRQHVEPSPQWGGAKRLAEIRRRDAIKDCFAKDSGYVLLRIPHYRFDQIDQLVGESLLSTLRT